MLIKRAHLDGIVRGEVTHAYRRWKRPTVRAGGTLSTAVGQLAIESVDQVPEKSITNQAARQAGYPTREALRRDLAAGYRLSPRGRAFIRKRKAAD